MVLVASCEGPDAADLGHKGFERRVLCCMHVTIERFAGDSGWDCTDSPIWQSAFPCS